MSTQNIYTGFFARQIIGRETIRDHLHGSIRDDFADAFGEGFGECVIDPTAAGLSLSLSGDPVNDRKIDVVGDLTVFTDDGDVILNSGSSSSVVTEVEGARTITTHDPAWFTDLPFEDDNVTTYRVYVGLSRYPIDVQIGRNGNRGYGRWVDVPGFSVTAESVIDSGTHITLTVDSNLTSIGMQQWLTGNVNDDNWSYDVVVYLDTDVTGVEIASDDSDTAVCYFAKLKKRAAGDWRIDLDDGTGDGYLGQDTVDFDTDPSHYRIVILGPIITTTGLDSDPAWTLIGTVTGASTDTSAQIIVTSLSDLIDNLSQVQTNVLSKGWVVRPTVTTPGSNSIDVATGGTAFTQGKLYDLSSVSATFGSLTASSDIYVSYDPDTDSYVQFVNDWDSANAGDLVPIYWAQTDGGSNITVSESIGRLVKNFPDTVLLTLGGSDYSSSFRDLGDLLGALKALQDSATVPPKSFVVHVVGDVDQGSNTVTDPNLFDVKNVHFKGAKFGQPSVAAGDTGGALIRWSQDTLGLIRPSSGASIQGWTFENIRFRYEGNAANINVAVVTAESGSGGVNGLEFIGCFFDGVSAAGAQGMPCALVVSEQSSNIKFRDCRFEVTDCAIHSDGAGTDGMVDVVVERCEFDHSVGTPGFATQGFLVDAGANSARITMRDNEYTSAEGPLIDVADGTGFYVRTNRVTCNADVPAIDIGGSTLGPGASISRVQVVGNECDVSAAASHTDDIIRVNAEGATFVGVSIRDNQVYGKGIAGSSTGIGVYGDSAGWSVHDNMIDSVTTGVKINNGGSPATTDYSIVHDNIMYDVETTGIDIEELRYSRVGDNVIYTRDRGIYVSLGQMEYCTIANNLAVSDLGTPTALYELYGVSVITTGNLGYDNSGGLTSAAFFGDIDSGLWVGNLAEHSGIVPSFDVDGTNYLFIANTSPLASVDSIQGATVMVAANLLQGDLDEGLGLTAQVVGNTVLGDVDTSLVTGMYVGNWVTGNFTDVNTGLHFLGNRGGAITQDPTAAADGIIMVGNDMTVQFTGTGQNVQNLLLGNVLKSLSVTNTAASEWSILGNVWSTHPSFGAGIDQSTLSANVFSENTLLTLPGTTDTNAIVGNWFENSLTLDTGSTRNAVVGNMVEGGTITDNGTSNLVVTATDADPLNAL